MARPSAGPVGTFAIASGTLAALCGDVENGGAPYDNST